MPQAVAPKLPGHLRPLSYPFSPLATDIGWSDHANVLCPDFIRKANCRWGLPKAGLIANESILSPQGVVQIRALKVPKLSIGWGPTGTPIGSRRLRKFDSFKDTSHLSQCGRRRYVSEACSGIRLAGHQHRPLSRT